MIRRLFASFAESTIAHSTRNAAKGVHRRRIRATRGRVLRAFEPLEPRALLAITVTTFDDVFDPADGRTSLREAIQVAAENAGDDVIELPAGRYPLSGEQLVINDPSGKLNIEVPDGRATIDARQRSRVFSVIRGSDVEFRNLDITGGHVEAEFAGFDGGGILNGGRLVLINTAVVGNFAVELGGGVFNIGGELHLIGSTISQNHASAGGGISNVHGSLTVFNSTITQNSASFNGGGISHSPSVAMETVNVINSTVSGNSAGWFGGGIITGHGPLNIVNSTIVLNRANSGGTAPSDSGGGISTGFLEGSTLLHNTIVAGNVVGPMGAEVPSDLSDPSTSVRVNAASSHNLIGDPASSGGLLDGVNGNIVGVGGSVLPISDVIDLALVDNGGPTLTHALIAGSPAIDAGSNALAVDASGSPLRTDQRWFGFFRIGGAAVDIGSFEVQSPASGPLADLIREHVAELFEIETINHGQFISLSSKLELKGNLGDPGRVFSFTRQVRAFRQGGILNEQEALPLLSNARLLLAELAEEAGRQIDPIFDEKLGNTPGQSGFQLQLDAAELK